MYLDTCRWFWSRENHPSKPHFSTDVALRSTSILVLQDSFTWGLPLYFAVYPFAIPLIGLLPQTVPPPKSCFLKFKFKNPIPMAQIGRFLHLYRETFSPHIPFSTGDFLPSLEHNTNRLSRNKHQ